MSRPIIVLLTTLCLLLAPRALQAGPPTTQQAQAAIDAVLTDPLAAEKDGHAATVMSFAEQSPDVSVIIDAELLPFANDRQNPHARLLLASFVAGNVKSQLDSGKNKDDSYAGMQSLFKAYRAIRSTKQDYKVESIDKLEAMDNQGKLKAKVEEIQKRHGL